MTQLQESMLSELKSKEKFTTPEYVKLYNKYINLAIAQEEKKGGHKNQVKTMAEYYIISVLSDFLANENLLSRIIVLKDVYK